MYVCTYVFMFMCVECLKLHIKICMYVNMYVLDVDSNEAQVVIGDDDDGDQVGVHTYTYTHELFLN